MLFNGRALIFTFSRTQVRIAEIERLQSLFKMSMIAVQQCAEMLSRAKRPLILLGSQVTLPPTPTNIVADALTVGLPDAASDIANDIS